MIDQLIMQDEGRTLEFKENTQSLSSIIKSIIAFANTAGGIILIGIEDRTKKIIGIESALDEEERLSNAIADSIMPFLLPTINIHTVENKEVITIHVPYLVGPYFLKKHGVERGTYIRLGSTNRVADTHMLESIGLLAKRLSFDELPYPMNTVEDLDWQAMQQTFEKAEKKIDKAKAADLEIIVSHLGTQCPSQGGILLFGKNRTQIFPHAAVRCVRFIGTTKADILDHRDINTLAIQTIDEVIHFIKKNTLTGIQIGETRHIETPQYPPVAIREAVINAILHADYGQKGSHITIAIFDDRIEISNPGGLPFGMTLERALSGSSHVRNRVIARTFREVKLIEQWGSGIQRIMKACKDNNLIKPLFENFDTAFRVTLFAKKEQKKTIDPADNALIKHLKTHDRITTKEAAKLWNIAPRNARLKLRKALEKGLIKKVCRSPKDPKGYYQIT